MTIQEEQRRARQSLVSDFLKWAMGEPERVPAVDAPLAQDAEPLALDKDSVRTIDQDGHLHVGLSNISKANVCEYFAEEIPDSAALGLTPGKKYKLYRDPDELAKAADSFNGKPLLIKHKPQYADSHDHDITVGSIHGVRFEAPFLKAELDVWDGDAIASIQSGAQRELSCGYRYVATMEPGTTPDGVKFDGRMTAIRGNHCALVAAGRAGGDVMVGDSAPPNTTETGTMQLSKRAAVARWVLMTHLVPKLAKDAKLDITPALLGIDEKNFKAKVPDIVKGVQAIVKPLLAKDDASPDDVMLALVNMIDGGGGEETLPAVPGEAPPADAGAGADPAAAAVDPAAKKDGTDPDPAAAGAPNVAEIQAAVAKAPPDVLAKIAALLKGGAADEPPPFKGQPKVGGAMDEKELAKAITAAVDKAKADTIKLATDEATKIAREIRDAERKVRPYVGDLAIACDSAEMVFRTTLKTLGVKNADTMHKDALEAVLDQIPKPGAKTPRATPIAADAAHAKSLAERVPGLGAIRLQ